MSKLYKLKSWFTVPEVAQHLTRLFEEPVTPADVLQLALDFQLSLSVRFTYGVYARPLAMLDGESVIPFPAYRDGANKETLDGELVVLRWVDIGDDPERPGMTAAAPYKDSITRIGGEWDLPVEGAARNCVEEAYQRLTGGKPIDDSDFSGVIVKAFDNSQAYQLLARFKGDSYKEDQDTSFFPSPWLPDNDASVLGMRREALHTFVASIVEGDKPESQQTASRSAETRTAGSLLSIIRALLHGVKLNPDDKKAVSTIQRWSESTGYDLTAETIKKYLKQISDT